VRDDVFIGWRFTLSLALGARRMADRHEGATIDLTVVQRLLDISAVLAAHDCEPLPSLAGRTDLVP
jgi:hypothetical protein